MHIIELENMEFFANHGCFSEEQIIGNKFIVNLQLKANETISKDSDNISDAVNYQKIYDIVNREMKITSHLLEHVCNRILNSIYSEFGNINISEVKIKISKINPPMGGKIGSSSITMIK